MTRIQSSLTIVVVLAVAASPVLGLAGAVSPFAAHGPEAQSSVDGSVALAANNTNTFAVSNLSAPANATSGATITATANVTNTGNATGNQTVTYRFNGSDRLSTAVELAPGTERSVSFSFNTSGVAPGNYTHAIATDDDTASAAIEITAASDGSDGSDESDGGVDAGPDSGPPPADMAAWRDTKPVRQTSPSSLGGKIRVEDEYRDQTSVELVTDSPTNFTMRVTVTDENATNVTFFLQKAAIQASQDIENLAMYLDDQPHAYYEDEAGPGNSPWVLFEIDHFSTRTVSFQVESIEERRDADGSGAIETDELRTAITDWTTGSLTTSELRDLIRSWATT